ncbi:hypothetical protein M405DRAFT_520560 [Rhizopogon salebrosus TDB-379]|nr:hypothetical protein M405DRAFT_520560 [Rhizopogon salebrosus TDB-379]
MSSMTLRILSFWVALFAITAMASPIDSQLASLITSNMGLNCIHGCAAANSSQVLKTNSAFTSASGPNSFLLGAILLVGGVMVVS